MGLDMYAFRHKGERITSQTDREKLEGTNREIVMFSNWRKHNRLQGFMENIWNKKTGHHKMGVFNCEPLYLDRSDLDKLEEAIRSRSLPKTGGFFFGQDSYTWEGEQEDMKAYDLKFVTNAKKYLNEGYEVFYECWW